ncbi:MAG TPA: hypothetical protein VK875_01750 [Euzebyales bacterium]|nr:hypothetical protein [Euzebyales bacterium]
MAGSPEAQPHLRQSRHNRVVGGDRLQDYGNQRRCAADDCGTLLSRYNPSSTCTVHAGWKDTRQRSHA